MERPLARAPGGMEIPRTTKGLWKMNALSKRDIGMGERFSIHPSLHPSIPHNERGAARLCRAGFTLIELLVVIVIIGILAGALFMMVGAARNKSAIAETTAQIHAIATLLEEYKAIYGDYPVVTQSLDDVLTSSEKRKYFEDTTKAPEYAPLDFKFVTGSGSPGCKYCGFTAITNSNHGDEIAFGLCSHFVPRATIIADSVSDDLTGHYNEMYRNPAADTPWATEIRGLKNTNKALEATSANEAADTNLQQIYRSWRRLEKDGLVKSEVTYCVECGAHRFTAGAKKDAWDLFLAYHNTGGAGEIVSAGPDGKFGTADDITASGAAVTDDDD